MMRVDLAVAGIPYQDADGLYADLHASDVNRPFSNVTPNVIRGAIGVTLNVTSNVTGVTDRDFAGEAIAISSVVRDDVATGIIELVARREAALAWQIDAGVADDINCLSLVPPSSQLTSVCAAGAG